MVLHLSIFVTSCLICLLYGGYDVSSKTSKKVVIIAASLFMAFFLAMRTWWMADNIKYHTQFVGLTDSSFMQILKSEYTNIGLRTVFMIVNKLTDGNFQIVLIIQSLFCMGCLGYTVYKYSVSPFWSYFAYFVIGMYFFNFSGMKQSVAMGFILLSFGGIAENKPWKFYIFSIIAGMFHAPAFISIIAYWFSTRTINRNYIIFLISTFIFVLIFRNTIVSLLADMYYEKEIGEASGVGGKFLAMLIILAGSYILRPPANEDSVYSKVFNLIVLAALIQSFSIFGYVFTRLADYYFQFMILFLPFVMEYHMGEINDPLSDNTTTPILSFNRRSFVLVGCVLFVLGFYYYRSYIRTDISGILNYQYFWEVAETPWGS